VQLEQKGILRQYRVRANDQIVYEALESVLRQQNPEDLNTNVVGLCARLIAEGHPGFR
jgi:hypothetical protein